MQLRTAHWMAMLGILALVATACGSPSNTEAESDADHAVTTGSEETHDETEETHDETEETHDETESSHDDDAEHSEDVFAFGQPAESSSADRTIEVDAKDDFTFSPNQFEVSAGETIQFVITNSGAIPHDFTLGDQEAQEAHEEEMAEGGMDHSDPNAVVLEPGETKTLTWKFTEADTVLIGCHQPGHYPAGMTGTIDVAA